MDHDDASVLLTRCLDRVLGVAEALAVERHPGACAECQRECAR
jgi:hypothetical protein